MTHHVTIDGKEYREVSDAEKSLMRLLAEVHGELFTEAHYDPRNESTQKFAQPLYEKMRLANEIMRFSR